LFNIDLRTGQQGAWRQCFEGETQRLDFNAGQLGRLPGAGG
jgi:hypothetical protein